MWSISGRIVTWNSERRQRALVDRRVHEFVVGPGDNGNRRFCPPERGFPVLRPGVAQHEPERVLVGDEFLRLRPGREGENRQRLCPVDAEPGQRHKGDDARHVGQGPVARLFGRSSGRRAPPEIGREQDEALERAAERAGRDAQAVAAARRMPDEGKFRVGTGPAQLSDEVCEVIVELAGIGDVAASARRAVAAEIDFDRSNSHVGERRARSRSFGPKRLPSRERGSRFCRSPCLADKTDRRATCRHEPESG